MSQDFITRLSGELSGYILADAGGLPTGRRDRQWPSPAAPFLYHHGQLDQRCRFGNPCCTRAQTEADCQRRRAQCSRDCLVPAALRGPLAAEQDRLDRSNGPFEFNGARWNDVYLYLMNSGTGLIPIGGGCPTVGIPGFMLGGGFSFVSRSYGMSIDNLISVGIVTADGELRRISKNSKSKHERDLFWACQGGGGGNFGIAVDMEIQVHQPPTPKMFMGQIRYNPESAQEVLGFYNEWVETLPDELAVYGIWGNQPDPADPAKTINTFGFTSVYNGSFQEGLRLIEPLLQLKAKPIYAQLNSFTLPEFEEANGRRPW